MFLLVLESTKRVLTSQVQKQQWMAKALGCFHQLLSLFLQNVSSITNIQLMQLLNQCLFLMIFLFLG